MARKREVLVLGLIGLCALAAGCVPERYVPVEAIPKIHDLGDLMAVQATYADPQFKKIGAATYSDADFTAFVDAGRHLEATSAHIPQFSKGPGFDALARQLHIQADALVSAGQAHDASGARTALREMKSVCKSCHSQYR